MIDPRRRRGSCALILRIALNVAAVYALWLAQAWQPARAGNAWIACIATSHHFDRSKGYNERNWGCGVEYGVAQDTRLVAGAYRNSLFRESTYAGALWLPLQFGPAKAGFIGGVVNGYRANGGGFSPVVVPMITLEGHTVGINVLATPRYRDSPGVIGMQIKFQIN